MHTEQTPGGDRRGLETDSSGSERGALHHGPQRRPEPVEALRVMEGNGEVGSLASQGLGEQTGGTEVRCQNRMNPERNGRHWERGMKGVARGLYRGVGLE